MSVNAQPRQVENPYFRFPNDHPMGRQVYSDGQRRGGDQHAYYSVSKRLLNNLPQCEVRQLVRRAEEEEKGDTHFSRLPPVRRDGALRPWKQCLEAWDKGRQVYVSGH